jgi:hexosaminidase
MKVMIINLNKTPKELHTGLKEIAKVLPVKFSGKGLKVNFSNQGKGLEISADKNDIGIIYKTVNDAFRGLGLLSSRSLADIKKKKICEVRRLEKCFVMLDASRNGVLNEKSVAEWLRFFALAGINGFMLYTEDTYEVKGEPLFGYMRGRYSKKELKSFDKLADSLGIEMIPCIQTLAHLQRILQYGHFVNIKDTESVMLCEEPETMKFVEKMLKEASEPYKSKRIHIGMDEAWDLGRGQYIDKKGFKEPFDMMTEHLKKVLKVTEKLKLQPMMWSDMFFRALSKTGQYYDTDVKFNKKIIDQVPKNVELVYWDYYHFKESDYSMMVDQHIKLNDIPIMAPGIHTWGRFWAACSHSEETMKNAMKSCFNKGVNEMIITIWGDDGTECDYFSALPLLQYASDMIFTGKTDIKQTKENLKGTLGIDYDSWIKGEKIDRMPGNEGNTSISKSLLWDDPLIGLWQPQKNGAKLNAYYSKLSKELKKEVAKKINKRLMLPYLLADVLSLKADFPELLQDAYLKKNKKALKKMLNETLPAIITKVRKLNLYHRKLWLSNYKSFGWEVIERRYGGLLGVLDNLKFKLAAYLKGELDKIEELEVKKHKMVNTPKGTMAHSGTSRVYSTGHIAH